MDRFDEVVELWADLGLSPGEARQAAIGREWSESAARRSWTATTGAERTPAPQPPAAMTATEAEWALDLAARKALGMNALTARRYAQQRRQYAEGRYGAEGAAAYLAQLAESLRRRH